MASSSTSNKSASENNPFANYGTDALKYFQNFHVPGMDLENSMKASQKSIEALNEAQHLATEVAKSLAQCQSQYARTIMEDMASYTRDMMTTGANMQDKAVVQSQCMKKCVHQALQHSRDLTNLLNKAQDNMLKMWENRFNECLDETQRTTQAAMKKAS